MERTRSYRSLLADLDLTGLTAGHRALLARGVRGGDGEETTDDLLAQVEGAADLEDDALASLIDALKTSAHARVADPASASDDDIAKASEALKAVKGLQTIVDTRTAEAAERASRAQALLDELATTDEEPEAAETDPPGHEDEGDDEDEPDPAVVETDPAPVAEETPAPEAETPAEVVEPEAEPVPVPIAASATPARMPVVSHMRPRGPDMRPRARETASIERFALRATANVPHVASGERLDSEGFGQALMDTLQAGDGYRGATMNVPVASVGSLNPRDMWGEERTLDYNDRENERKIGALIGGDALRASGGFCAPVPFDYSQPVLGTDERPVRGALSRFGADRGGVQLIPAPTMGQAVAGVGIWTAANDITPSDPATKPCVTMTCPAAVSTQVYAVTTCVKIDNFRNMYFRENVDAFVRKLTQAAARTAEARLLTAIGAGSTNVSTETNLGTTRDVLPAIDRAAAGMRYRQRLGRNFPFRLIAPAWLLDNIRTDLAREAPGAMTERLATADAYIENFFASRNINVAWALDGETGQTFGAQTDGPLNGWPTKAIVYLYAEGQWLYLDGGMLNLGVVRDATLVGTNDAIVFSEFMENVAFHGEESQRISIDICPSGAAQALVDISDTICAGGS